MGHRGVAAVDEDAPALSLCLSFVGFHPRAHRVLKQVSKALSPQSRSK